MKKIIAIFLVPGVVFCSNIYAQKNSVDSVHLFTIAELQQDFNTLRAKLEKSHPNLYLYTPKQVMDNVFDSLYKAINKPMGTLGFYSLIAPLTSIIKDGHGYVLPPEKARNYFNANSRFLPLHITIHDGRLFVDMNCSADTTLKDGAEITSINNTTAETIIKALLARQPRDGYNTTYPLWILNNWFREYYSYVFGHAKTYTITYRQNSKAIGTVTMPGLTKDSIKYYSQLRYASRLPKPTDKAISVSINSNERTALLTIKTFDDDDLKYTYKQQFKKAIQTCFAQINESAVSTLVIDLRNNQGGEPANGVLLLSYLLDSAFEMIHIGPVQAGFKQPGDNVYKGRLYVLVNGGSFSNTGMVAACLYRNKRAEFIGEETGGSKTILSGDAFTLVLPNTNIEYEVSTKVYLLVANTVLGYGVIPEHIVVPGIDDIIKGNDKVLNYAWQLAGKDK